ncbi:MAG: superoxide dismutase [Caulobacteraceae bacterium]|nr:superoxide dismutase [Caulobacteraceae bacterium]
MFTLPDLPYGYDALQPTMSAETLHLHHDKHHARYFAVTNEILAGKTAGSLEDVIVKAAQAGEKKLFNNAAQAWNHTFFWHSMTPAKAAPAGPLLAAITAAFGGLEGLKTKFVDEGSAHFGSGWVWLAAAKDGALSVVQSHDGENLLGKDLTPLLVCDLWEHAYYVDYRNDRAAFLKAWFDALPNWALAQSQLAAAKGQGPLWTHP